MTEYLPTTDLEGRSVSFRSSRYKGFSHQWWKSRILNRIAWINIVNSQTDTSKWSSYFPSGKRTRKNSRFRAAVFSFRPECENVHEIKDCFGIKQPVPVGPEGWGCSAPSAYKKNRLAIDTKIYIHLRCGKCNISSWRTSWMVRGWKKFRCYFIFSW